MSKNKRSIVLLMMGAILSVSLASCNNGGTGGGGGVDDYGISTETVGPKLLGILHDRMMDTHQVYIKYNQVNSYLTTNPSTDENPDDSSQNILFYSGKRVKKGASITREHVWACANSSGMWTHTSSDGQYYVDGANYRGGGSDLYHIRPCNSFINTVRGNGKFMEFPDDAKENEDYFLIGESGGLYQTKCNQQKEYSTKVEPADEYKGDVARILMYVYVHYSSELGSNDRLDATKKSYLGNLRLNQVFNSSYNYQQIYELMVKWNKLDPVDEHEKKRNDTIEQIQGNRNPFVDHPEYMARCFGIDE